MQSSQITELRRLMRRCVKDIMRETGRSVSSYPASAITRLTNAALSEVVNGLNAADRSCAKLRRVTPASEPRA